MDNTGLTICGRKLYMGPRCTWLLLFFCFVLQIVLKVSPDIVDIRIFCCLFVVCIYMFGWLCRATYCSVVSSSMLGVSHAIQNEKNSRSLQRVIQAGSD